MFKVSGKGSPERGKLRFMEALCQKIRKGQFFRTSDNHPQAVDISGYSGSGDTGYSDKSDNIEGEKGSLKKFAIILHAEPGTHDAMGRALHSMLYSKELKEAGHEVRLLFDGGGTKWVEEVLKPGHPLGALFTEVKELGLISGVCEYCISAFDGNVEVVKQAGLATAGEFMGHPSIAALVTEGFDIITL